MIDLSVGEDRVGVIRFDTPGEKVNIITEASLARLASILAEAEQGCRDGRIRAVVVASAKKGNFLAGADVKAFVAVANAGDAAAATAKAREGQRLFTRLATLPVPSVAAINGVCLGGGLELALACSSRVAGDAMDVSMGLPEVRLGLIPGWGGTQRLPRLVGLTRSLDLILTGRTLSSHRALRIGLVDAVVPSEGLERAARTEALRLAGGGRPRRPAWPLLDRSAPGRALTLSIARRRALRETKGRYPAPLAALDAVGHGLRSTLEDGLARESELLGRLLVGDVSKSLVSLFLAGRAAVSSDAAPPARLGVLGAGTMGGGIAAVAAMSGIAVRLRDVSAEALARGMRQVRALATGASKKGRLPRHEAARREALVGPTVDLSGFSRCDLVIEAVVEDLEVKRQVLRDIEALGNPATIFATNTSSLPVAEIAAQAARPGRVLGLHFFNPVEKMPLVEVVRAPATEETAVQTAVALARRMGKTPVVVRDTPGFVVNRILMPYLSAAIDALAAGGDIAAIDRGMVGFGMPMGPFALLDRIGIDVAAKVAGVLKAAFPDRPGDGRLLESMSRAGLLGVKAGKGFYRYRGGAGAPRPAGVSPEVAPLVASTYPLPPAAAARADGAGISDTLVDVMVNEAALLLGEGAVERPETIDLAMVMGAGFPPFRGGLLRHADAVGHEAIAQRLRARGITPAPLLVSEPRFHR